MVLVEIGILNRDRRLYHPRGYLRQWHDSSAAFSRGEHLVEQMSVPVVDPGTGEGVHPGAQGAWVGQVRSYAGVDGDGGYRYHHDQQRSKDSRQGEPVDPPSVLLRFVLAFV